MRDDLPIGDLIAQCIHTAGESFRPPPKSRDPTYAVALKASKQQLEALERRLQMDGIDHVAIREPDEPYYGEITGLGACGDKKILYHYFKRYTLI